MHSDDGRYDAFLCFLSYNGNVTVSAEHSGLSLSAVRRRQGLSRSFADAMDNAKEAAADRLRFEAWQRAVHGEDVPYYYQGVQVGSKRRRSDQLMAQLLRALSQHDTTLDKDEAWTLCFIFVIIACFIPSAQTYIERGFFVLDNTPEWFRWAMLTSISASFGLRGFDKFIRRKGIVK